MKKHWKRILSLVCAFIITFSVNLNASAYTTPNTIILLNAKTQEDSNTFEVISSSGNQYSTWFGNSGSSRLDYMGSARSFAWGINVTTTSILPLEFTGSIDIYTASTGSYRGSIPLFGAGFGAAGGVAEIAGISSLRTGVLYQAYFSGTAINSAGKSFHVVSGAHIEFIYY